MKYINIEKAKEVLGSRFSLLYDFIEGVIDELNLDKNAKILDVGTGRGSMAIALALNGYNVITGEPESDNSEYAKQDWLESAKSVKVENLIIYNAFDAEDMPFEDNFFNAVFMFGALHHIANRTLALKECFRVIKKNGIICISEPNQTHIEEIRRNRPHHPDAEDPRNYTDMKALKFIKSQTFDAFIFKK